VGGADLCKPGSEVSRARVFADYVRAGYNVAGKIWKGCGSRWEWDGKIVRCGSLRCGWSGLVARFVRAAEPCEGACSESALGVGDGAEDGGSRLYKKWGLSTWVIRGRRCPGTFILRVEVDALEARAAAVASCSTVFLQLARMKFPVIGDCGLRAA